MRTLHFAGVLTGWSMYGLTELLGHKVPIARRKKPNQFASQESLQWPSGRLVVFWFGGVEPQIAR